MYKIILFTHGELGKSLVNSAAMLIGGIDDVDCFSIVPGLDPDSAADKLRQHLERYRAEGVPVLAFSDLFFGTPFNILASLSQEFRFWHITGVNLPMLIEALTPRNQEGAFPAELFPSLMETGRQSIVCCNNIIDQPQTNNT